MSADKCYMPIYVQFAQQLGINLLSTDVPKLVEFAEKVAVRATLAEREKNAVTIRRFESQASYAEAEAQKLRDEIVALRARSKS